MSDFPILYRPRRLRRQPWLRAMVAETRLHPSDLIWPLFLCEGQGEAGCQAVASMPGVRRLTLDALRMEAARALALGIPAVALFPATPPEKKSEDAAEAFAADNLVHRAVRMLKAEYPDLGVICDVALDPYTSHGHDGFVVAGEIDNDSTVATLARQAVALAEAGCDVVAPSDMMDGRVGAIRAALDAAGHAQVSILAYSAKYASAFYGPFRDAVGSKSSLGRADKRSYQMDPANACEAAREVVLDIVEGADMLMIKPGMPYLDILKQTAESTDLPVFAYQVSGEYAMLLAAIQNGWLEEQPAIMESLLAFKRAGARGILTYFAPQVAEWLSHK